MDAWKDKVKANWNQIKGKIKQKYADLTDEDLTYVEGKEDELIGRLQKKTGKAKVEIQSWFEKDSLFEKSGANKY